MPLRLIRWAICLVLLGLASGCTDSDGQSLQTAKEFEAKGDRAAAILTLKGTLQQQPDNGEMRYMLGRLYAESFDFAAAEKELLKARELGMTEDGRVEVALARALRAQHKFTELLRRVSAQPSFEKSQQASVLALRGRAQHVLKDFVAAQESFERASSTQADNPDVALLEAQILSSGGDFDDALAVVDTLLARLPDHYDAWSYKAELLRVLDRRDEALSAYEQLLRLHPLNLQGLLQHARLLTGKGEFKAAWKDVAVLQRVYAGQPEVLVLQGILQLQEGKAKDALDSARSALAKDRDLASANLLAGLAHIALDSFLQAEIFLNIAVAARPSEPLGRRALAQVLLHNGEPQRAAKVAAAALQQGSTDAELMIIAASAYAALGDNDQAIEWSKKAARLEPDNSGLKVQQALIRLRSGDPGAGLNSLESALSSMRKASQADELLVLSLLRDGHTDRAWTIVQALDKRVLDNPIAKNLRGLVLLAKGERDNAAKAFTAALALQPSFLPAAKNLAQLDIAAGDPNRAWQRYEAVIAADPNNSEALTILAQVKWRLGQREQAIALLERALKSAPEAILSRQQLVRAYLASGEARRAMDVAVAGLQAAPDDARMVHVAAQAMLAAGLVSQANNTISRLLQLTDNSPEIYLQVAQFQTSAKLTDEAENTLKRGLKTHPASSKVQIALVSLLVNQQRFEDAMSVAKDIAKRQPDAPIARVLEGEIHEAAGQYAQAVDAYEAALALQPASHFAVKRYIARSRAGQPDAALAELKAWALAHEDDIVANITLGDIMLAKGEYQAATEHFEKVVNSQTVTVDILNKLAWAYHKLQNDRAVEIAEAAYKVAPNSGMVVDTLGWILVDKGEIERGLELIRRAAVLAPDEPEIRYHLAVGLAKTGDAAGARAELTKLLASKKKFASESDAKALLASLN